MSRKSKRTRKKERDTGPRAPPRAHPWWHSRAPWRWRAVALAQAALSLSAVVWLALSTELQGRVTLGELYWEWDEIRLGTAYAAAFLGLALSWGIYKAEILSRLLSGLLWLGVFVGTLVITLVYVTRGNWPVLVAGIAGSLASLVAAYLVTLGQAKTG